VKKLFEAAYPKHSFEDFFAKIAKLYQKAWLQLGTLGGGNHFIEVDESKNGELWLVVHTGSRGFGKRISDAHQRHVIDSKYDSTIA
jgi:RNA-splicing ligase RtcB